MPGSRRFGRITRSLTLAAAITALPVAALADTPRERWHQDIATGYQQLADHTQQLMDAGDGYCQAPDASGRRQLSGAWLQAFESWQQVRFVEFGPIEQDSLAWQFQFWPDAKNLVARKVNYWLSAETELTTATIDGAGVAVQGFPALEFLLADPRFQQSEQALPAERSCQLFNAVSSHIHANALELQQQWQAMKPHYLATDDYTHGTIRSAMNALEILQDRRMGAPMGLRGSGRRNPYLADAWRSETSLAGIRASIEGLQRYFAPGLMAELAAQGHADLGEQLNDAFEEVLGDLENAPAGMAPLIEDDEGFGQLQSIYIDVVQLEQTLNNDIAAALGVIRGFNSSDGD